LLESSAGEPPPIAKNPHSRADFKVLLLQNFPGKTAFFRWQSAALVVEADKNRGTVAESNSSSVYPNT